MDIKITNNGRRRGFIQSHVLNPGESVMLKDVDKDGIEQLKAVQWLGVEKVEKKPKGKEEKTTNEVTE